MSQASLFDGAPDGLAVRPAAPSEDVVALADKLAQRWGGRLRLGTSSWYFPGWARQVWDRTYPEAALSRHGLRAYAMHPLLRTVSLDRAFYRPLDAATYAGLAAQVDEGFRFIVKAPAMVCDAQLREPGSGAGLRANPLFLDPQAVMTHCVQPVVAGLGAKLGTLVLQISPLPARWLHDEGALLARLEAVWRVARPALPADAHLALELRDAAPLTPALAASLQAHGVRYCLGLHDRLPSAQEQLGMLRATWPGDLICRWSLQRGLRYRQAREQWAPFDRLQAADLPTRQTLATVMRATLNAGLQVQLTINNKAEGSAPESVLALAQALALLEGL